MTWAGVPSGFEHAIFDAAVRSSFNDEEALLIGNILAKAVEIERETARRPTHVAMHPDTLKGVGRLWDLVVVRSSELVAGTAYLMIAAST